MDQKRKQNIEQYQQQINDNVKQHLEQINQQNQINTNKKLELISEEQTIQLIEKARTSYVPKKLNKRQQNINIYNQQQTQYEKQINQLLQNKAKQRYQDYLHKQTSKQQIDEYTKLLLNQQKQQSEKLEKLEQRRKQNIQLIEKRDSQQQLDNFRKQQQELKKRKAYEQLLLTSSKFQRKANINVVTNKIDPVYIKEAKQLKKQYDEENKEIQQLKERKQKITQQRIEFSQQRRKEKIENFRKQQKADDALEITRYLNTVAIQKNQTQKYLKKLNNK